MSGLFELERVVRRSLPWLLPLLLGGCHLIFPFQVSQLDGGGAAGVDMRPPDQITDLVNPLTDGSPVDGPFVAQDSVPPPDAGTPGCNPQVATQTIPVNAKMVFCEAAGKQFDQCSAETLCNTQGGWSLCFASTYRAQFDGTGAPPPLGKAWIAGCVRSGGAPHEPQDKICTCDLLPTQPQAPLAWDCADGFALLYGDMPHFGLLSNEACHWVGTKLPANAGYWYATYSTNSGVSAAVCCRP